MKEGISGYSSSDSIPKLDAKNNDGDTGVFTNTDTSDGDACERNSTRSEENRSAEFVALQILSNLGVGSEPIARDNEDCKCELSPVQENENNGPSSISSSIALSDHDRSYRYLQYLRGKERSDSAEKDEAITDLQLKLTLNEHELKTYKEKFKKLIDKCEKDLEKEILRGDKQKRIYTKRITCLEEERKQHITKITGCQDVVQDLKKRVEKQDEKAKRAELEKENLRLQERNEFLEMQRKYDGDIAQLKLEKSMAETKHVREKTKLEKEKCELEKQLEKKEEENKYLLLKIEMLEEKAQDRHSAHVTYL